MEIRRVRHSEGLEFRISGRFDAYRSGQLESDLDEAVRAGEYQVRVDLSGVDFISSAGIGLLVRFHNRLKSCGGSFGVRAASEPVAKLLQISGLWAMLASDFPGGEGPGGSEALVASRFRAVGPLACEIHGPETLRRVRCRRVGDPARLAQGGYGPDAAVWLSLPMETLAVGLGAFGPGYPECHARFGEFMATGGVAVCRPTDGSGVPDFMLARGGLVPEVVALYALAVDGGLDHFVRFQAAGPAGAVTLGEVLAAVLDILGEPAAALVMLADTAGLVGTALRRSPVQDSCPECVFEYPAVRDWLTFTPEREHARQLTLVAGVAAADPPEPLAAFLRPAAEPDIQAHCHATVFSFRALPRGRLDLGNTVRELFEEERVLDLLHLVRDHREIVGIGDSLFTRGVIWAGALDVGAGVEAP